MDIATETTLQPTISKANGKQFVYFKKSKNKRFVHRLVGLAFCDYPRSLPCARSQVHFTHIDGNLNNNHYSNLKHYVVCPG